VVGEVAGQATVYDAFERVKKPLRSRVLPFTGTGAGEVGADLRDHALHVAVQGDSRSVLKSGAARTGPSDPADSSGGSSLSMTRKTSPAGGHKRKGEY
jgi:hypothetical protein